MVGSMALSNFGTEQGVELKIALFLFRREIREEQREKGENKRQEKEENIR